MKTKASGPVFLLSYDDLKIQNVFAMLNFQIPNVTMTLEELFKHRLENSGEKVLYAVKFKVI